MIRRAQTEDVPSMIALAARKREEYALYQPMFWRGAANAQDVQTPFFEAQITNPNNLVFGGEHEESISGFIIASMVSAPPVYYPGGRTCVVDDFTVDRAANWDLIGRGLVDAVAEEAKAQGAVQMVVVCACLDEPKRKMLARGGYSVASEWHVKTL